jgi:hypothetical protein
MRERREKIVRDREEEHKERVVDKQ